MDALLLIHLVPLVAAIIWTRRVRRAAADRQATCDFWMESCLARELEAAQLRQIIVRYERGEPVPEAEIDRMMGELRAIGLIR